MSNEYEAILNSFPSIEALRFKSAMNKALLTVSEQLQDFIKKGDNDNSYENYVDSVSINYILNTKEVDLKLFCIKFKELIESRGFCVAIYTRKDMINSDAMLLEILVGW